MIRDIVFLLWRLHSTVDGKIRILERTLLGSRIQGTVHSEPKLATSFSSFSCFCSSFHSGFYDNSSATICIYENHINFTRAWGIPYKPILCKSADHKKQQPFTHLLEGKRRRSFTSMLIGKTQRPPFEILTLSSSLPFLPKKDFILTSQVVFPSQKVQLGKWNLTHIFLPNSVSA